MSPEDFLDQLWEGVYRADDPAQAERKQEVLGGQFLPELAKRAKPYN